MHTILNVINIARGSHTGCKCYIYSKAFDVMCHVTKVTKRISWSLLGPGVEVGVAPNIMKGINIFIAQCN
jgi:hypothetical protein